MLKPNNLYNSTIVVEYATEVLDHGGITYTYSGVSGIRSRAVKASASETKKYGRKVGEIGYRFHVDPSIPATTNDRVVFEGTTYEIVDSNDHHSMSVFRTIMAFKAR